MTDSVEVMVSVYKPDWTYLEEQLRSVLGQEDVSVKISIRDDTGSESHALELKTFIRNKFPCETNINVFAGANLGPGMSFLELCYMSNLGCDYYAFCDQDDVWSNNKLVRAIECMKNEGAGLYASTLSVTDGELNHKGKTVKPKLISFENSLTENVVTGCTAVFDRDLMSIIKSCRPEYVTMHDHWLYMTGAAFSKIYFDDYSYIKYRQHGGNVIGDKTWQYYLRKSVKFIAGVVKGKRRISHQVESFALCYSGALDDSTKEKIELFLGMRKKMFIRILKSTLFNRNGFLENSIFRIKFILGLY